MVSQRPLSTSLLKLKLQIQTEGSEEVLEVGHGKAVVQVFEGTTGLAISGTKG